MRDVKAEKSKDVVNLSSRHTRGFFSMTVLDISEVLRGSIGTESFL